MRYFIDTEFIESGPSYPLILLSIGIVAEDGREFYAVNEDAPLELASDWVRANVIPHLGGPKVGITKIGPGIIHWMTDLKPEFWGYYADYDWVVFCQLFGTSATCSATRNCPRKLARNTTLSLMHGGMLKYGSFSKLVRAGSVHEHPIRHSACVYRPIRCLRLWLLARWLIGVDINPLHEFDGFWLWLFLGE